MKKKGWTALFGRKQYVIAGTLVVIAAIGTTVLYSNNQEKERAQMEAELAEEMNQKNEEVAAVEETEAEESAEASAVIQPEIKEEAETAEASDIAEKVVEEQIPAKETTKGVEPLHFSSEDGMLWPMEGNVIMNYSMDATIYHATLDQYKYNPAVIIAGDVNSKVFAAARGQIQSIENSEETGCTVTVNMGDGYQAVYGQLKELNFDVGDYVESGHVIGYISEPTKYFSVEGSNLYFELLKDGEPIDPVTYFQ